MRDRRVFLGILAAALVLRLAFAAAAGGADDRYLLSDATEYVALGNDAIDAYTDEDHPYFHLSLDRPPVYPFWLATIFTVAAGSLDVAVVVQAIVGVATVAAVYALAGRLVGRQGAVLAAALTAVDFTAVVWGSFLQPEALFTLELVAALWAWHRGVREGPRWWLAVAGGLLGVAVLTRPVAVFFPPLLAVLTWVVLGGRWQTRLRWTATLVVVALVPVAAWIARNDAETGVPLLSTVEGRNLLLYRAAGAVAEEDGRSIDLVRADLLGRLGEELGSGANPGERSEAETDLALEVLADHPRGAAVSAVKGVARLLAGPGQAPIATRLDRGEPGEADTFVERAVVGLSLLSLVAIYVVALGGIYVLIRRRDWLVLTLLLGGAAYFVLISAGADAYGRFRVPVMPLLAIVGGATAAFGQEPAPAEANPS